jgi:hypothetical protein
MGPDEVLGGREVLGVAAIDGTPLARVALWTPGIQMRNAGATGGNALPKDDPTDVTRCKVAAAKRLQAHRRWKRMGLRCLTVRVNESIVRHLISSGYLSLENREVKAAVAIALEAWISDNLT